MIYHLNRPAVRIEKSGFTLLEVLVAMAIGMIAFLSLAAMQGVAVHGNHFGNRLTQATVLAQAKLEQLNSTLLSPNDARVTNLKAGDPITLKGLDEHGNLPGEDQPDGPFTLTWQVSANTAFSRIITVTVTWDSKISVNGVANTHQVQLSSVTRGIFL